MLGELAAGRKRDHGLSHHVLMAADQRPARAIGTRAPRVLEQLSRHSVQ
jgi:hypothetical protein